MIPDLARGEVICYREPSGAAVLWWTYQGTGLVIHAMNSRGDSSALYSFFIDSRRFITP